LIVCFTSVWIAMWLFHASEFPMICFIYNERVCSVYFKITCTMFTNIGTWKVQLSKELKIIYWIDSMILSNSHFCTHPVGRVV
jgi:hypothetical protein